MTLNQTKHSKIRLVQASEKGRVEGLVSDMPWIAAEEKFKSFFSSGLRGSCQYEIVQENAGCRTNDAKQWANATNKIIGVLNGLNDDATEDEVMLAFDLA